MDRGQRALEHVNQAGQAVAAVTQGAKAVGEFLDGNNAAAQAAASSAQGHWAASQPK